MREDCSKFVINFLILDVDEKSFVSETFEF